MLHITKLGINQSIIQ